ncbi:MAG: hypothetical protein ACO3B3_09925 [Cyanobium sp.]
MNKKSLNLAVLASAISILATYLIAVITSSYPFSILDPSWQLNFTVNAVDNGGIVLVSLLLFAFSATLNIRNKQSSHLRIFRLAIWPMLGFLLIPPLYLVASVRLKEKVRSENVIRFEKASRRLEELSSKINAASSSQDIDLILRKFQGKGLTGPQLNLPPNRIRSELLSQLQEARRQLLQQIPSEQALQPLPLIINGTRIILSSLAYSIALAAFARRPKSQVSLMEELVGVYQNRRRVAGVRHRERQAFLKTIADSQLEQQAMAAQESAQFEANIATEFSPQEEDPLQSKKLQEFNINQDPPLKRRRAVDQDYFESLIQEPEDDKVDHKNLT